MESALICQASPIFCPKPALRRGTCALAISSDTGEGLTPMLAARNLSMSLAVDRMAPQPARLEKSQLGTGLPAVEWPEARRALPSAVSVMQVLPIRSGSQIRRRTNDS